MDLVLCHRTADFDTLGAAVGIVRLQPGTRIVLCGGAHPAVRNFLALYRNEYPLIECRAVNADKLRSITVVDAQKRELLGNAAEWLEQPDLRVVVIDHHLDVTCDIGADRVELEPVGATTTLIAEKLQKQQLQLSVSEATVMALGIHVDTGSLTYDHTTVRDAAALTWLMDQGANQQAIADYIEPGFSSALQELLGQALETLQSQSVHGYRVSWVLLQTPSYTPGLSSLASELMVLSESESLLLSNLYKTRSSGKDRLTVIARSRLEGVDLNQLLQPLGGGGHPQAAAVTLKTPNPEFVLTQLVEDLILQIPLPPTAQDLMSSPVRTIRPEVTINQAQRILLRYGHSGLSIVNAEDELVGIISRRDLDLALHHGFGHAPVKGYMKAPVRTITPTTHLPDIERLMVTYDIGRLPVVEKGQLVGIVTRTDILRQLHQQKQPPAKLGQQRVQTSIQTRLQTLLSPALQEILTHAAAAAEQQGWQLYLVGGAVRDLLLLTAGQSPDLKEFDLVVDGMHTREHQGAGVALARSLHHAHPDTQLQIYGQFQTAALIWGQASPLGSFAVDIATARSEFYPYPAANPEVAASSIRQDLYRRDFTINALAIRLTRRASQQSQPGELLDFFGGLVDLEQRLIRVLHPNSFIEDPTRIFRAVRFATRLQFTIEAQTEAYIRHAIASGIYQQTWGGNGKVPALQSRLKAELRLIFKSDHWPQALKLIADLGALQCIHPQLKIDRHWWRQVRLALRWWTCLDPQATTIHQWTLILEVLLTALANGKAGQVAATLNLPETSQQRLGRFSPVRQTLHQQLPLLPRPSQIYQTLQTYDLPLLILVAIRSPAEVRRQIWWYLSRGAIAKPLLNGKDLIQLGYRPGPHFKEILAAILAATLDGDLQTREAAIQFVGDRFPPGTLQR